MTKHYKILVEYDPKLAVQQREDVDRLQMQRLVKEHPGSSVVKMARHLISDHRAYLYAVLEWKEVTASRN